jgi:hypothetical protein
MMITYVGNNPTNLTDPLGLLGEDCDPFVSFDCSPPCDPFFDIDCNPFPPGPIPIPDLTPGVVAVVVAAFLQATVDRGAALR